MDTLLASPMIVPIVAVLVVSALAHGALGFGFPVISTPVVAMMTDIQTAILVTLFPNLAVNLVSIFRGGNLRASLARYWPLPVYVAVGTIVGTRFLLVIADPEPLKLLLAAMIVVFLQQARFRRLDWSWLKRHPHGSGLAFGLLAGFLSGTVNVAVPPLVIYFMGLGLDALPMTQILNLCFFVGRGMQAVTFGISGTIGLATLVATLPLTLLSLAVLAIGMRIQSRIHPEVYQQLLRKVLWVMAALLVIQVVRHYLA
jgi:uncharacterized membrane protein YfcA